MVAVMAEKLVAGMVVMLVGKKAALTVHWWVDTLVGLMADWRAALRAGHLVALTVSSWVAPMVEWMADRLVEMRVASKVASKVASRVDLTAR